MTSAPAPPTRNQRNCCKMACAARDVDRGVWSTLQKSPSDWSIVEPGRNAASTNGSRGVWSIPQDPGSIYGECVWRRCKSKNRPLVWNELTGRWDDGAEGWSCPWGNHWDQGHHELGSPNGKGRPPREGARQKRTRAAGRRLRLLSSRTRNFIHGLDAEKRKTLADTTSASAATCKWRWWLIQLADRASGHATVEQSWFRSCGDRPLECNHGISEHLPLLEAPAPICAHIPSLRLR